MKPATPGTAPRIAPRLLPRHPVVSWGAAAKRLRVSKSHLWRVVHGERPGETLLERYQELVREIEQRTSHSVSSVQHPTAEETAPTPGPGVAWQQQAPGSAMGC